MISLGKLTSHFGVWWHQSEWGWTLQTGPPRKQIKEKKEISQSDQSIHKIILHIYLLYNSRVSLHQRNPLFSCSPTTPFLVTKVEHSNPKFSDMRTSHRCKLGKSDTRNSGINPLSSKYRDSIADTDTFHCDFALWYTNMIQHNTGMQTFFY